MAGVNMDALVGRFQRFLRSPDGVARRKECARTAYIEGQSLGGMHTPEEAADKFIEVLKKSIASSGVSDGVAEAITDGWEFGAVKDLGSGKFEIVVSFSGDLHRESLWPEGYEDGVTDLAELYNFGHKGNMKPVWGEWHGKEIISRTTIPGVHFMETAVSDFLSNYAAEYNVTSVEIQRK